MYDATHPLTDFWNSKLFWKRRKKKKQKKNLVETIYLKYERLPKNLNVDEFLKIGTHWIASYRHKNEILYFDSFRAEYI